MQETIDNNEIKPKESNKEIIWMSLFVVVPVVLFMRVGEYFSSDFLIRIVYGAFSGGILGGIGLGLYLFVSKKSLVIKLIVLLSFLTFITISLVLINNTFNKKVSYQQENLDYETCQVCGYKAFIEEEKFCDECFMEISLEEAKKEGLASINELIYTYQLFYFTPDTLITKINFFEPKLSEEGFEKDMNWSPIVPNDSILKFNREILEEI